MEKIGKRIRIARMFSEYSQKHLAELVGKSERTISNYEKGTTEASASLLSKIAKACDVSVVWLSNGAPGLSPDITKNDSPRPEELHNKIRSARGAKGYTQEEIAKLLGIAKNTFINYEKGFTRIPAETLNKFNELCGVDLGTTSRPANKEIEIIITIKISTKGGRMDGN